VEWTWNDETCFEMTWHGDDEAANREQAFDLVTALNAHPRLHARMLISEEREVQL
jgi:hypothetical protein